MKELRMFILWSNVL